MRIEKFPKILIARLKQYGESNENIEEFIEIYELQAKSYIDLMLGELVNKLTPQQKEILIENYIQYQLFARVEMESFVKDKKDFIDEMINRIIENDLMNRNLASEKNKNNRGIKVF